MGGEGCHLAWTALLIRVLLLSSSFLFYCMSYLVSRTSKKSIIVLELEAFILLQLELISGRERCKERGEVVTVGINELSIIPSALCEHNG